MNTLLPFFLLMLVTFPVLGRAFYQKANLPGVFLAFGVALPAWYLGKALPIMGGAVFGILLGMLLAFVKRPSSVEPGLKAVSKKCFRPRLCCSALK
jgi:uncharacterized membrane protein YadS